MSKSNPQIAVDSLPLTRSFQLGPNVADPLTPDAFTKSGNYFLNTWREMAVQNGDWGSTWNYIAPESLNVVSSHFLEIDLPAIGGGSYKAVPGMYAIQKLKLLSNGSEVYDLDYLCYMREFLSSVTDEEYEQFVSCYMGGATASGDARTICCPLFLPNSHYLRRHSSTNYGVFPHKLGTKLEFQITMASGARIAAQGSQAPASISNTARVVTREIKGDHGSGSTHLPP